MDEQKAGEKVSNDRSKRSSGEATTTLEHESKRLCVDTSNSDTVDGESGNLDGENDDDVGASQDSVFDFEVFYQDLYSNDSSITDLSDTSDFPMGFARPLGGVLMHGKNTHVESLNICLQRAVPKHKLYTRRRSGVDRIKAYVDPLVQYVATSANLRYMAVSNGDEDESDNEDGSMNQDENTAMADDDDVVDHIDVAAKLAEILAAACFQNCNIVELDLFPAPLPLHALSDLHRATSLTKLEINISNHDPYSAPNRDLIVKAFRGFTELTELTAKFPFAELGEDILSSLTANTDSKLTDLALFYTYDSDVPAFWSALVAFLDQRHHQPLQRLSLGFFHLHGQSMVALIRGLTGPPLHNNTGGTIATAGTADASRRIKTVKVLRFADCIFQDDAKHMFLELMQTRVTETMSSAATENRDSTPTEKPSTLQGIHFEENMGMSDFSAADLVDMLSLGEEVTRSSSSTMAEGPVDLTPAVQAQAAAVPVGSASVSLVNGLDGELSSLSMAGQETRGLPVLPARELYYPTIGSQIKAISLRPLHRFPLFLGHLAARAHRIRLSTIVTSITSARDMRMLARCIADLSSLQEFIVKCNPRLVHRCGIVPALKENGNLKSVHMSLEDDTKAAMLVNAYGERNQFLDTLLLKSTCTKDSDNSATESPSETCTISHCPVLLQTAQQTPGTRQSALIGSLMRLQETIRDDD